MRQGLEDAYPVLRGGEPAPGSRANPAAADETVATAARRDRHAALPGRPPAGTRHGANASPAEESETVGWTDGETRTTDRGRSENAA